MIRCNANLFRLASLCQSTEETRYYLCGVLVEPHPAGGVLLVTTDGHKLLVIHDEQGEADETAIISLSPEALKSCKPGKGENRRVVSVDGADATILRFISSDKDETGKPVAMSYNCRVDGTFPDFRRVIPSEFGRLGAPGLSATTLTDLVTVSLGLASHFCDYRPRAYSNDRPDAMRIFTETREDGETCPALILWPSIPQAFAIIMPVKTKTLETIAVPTWFRAPPADTVAPEAIADAPELQAAE